LEHLVRVEEGLISLLEVGTLVVLEEVHAQFEQGL